MQLLMALALSAFSSVSCLFTSANATDQKADFSPLLTCIDEIQGVFEGVEYDQPSRVVDCGRTVTYCQKITAHYMSAISETHVEMRGCDPVQLGDHFDGVPCVKEGCHTQVIKSETYNVCCCSSSMCNSAKSHEQISFLTVLISLISLVTLL